MGICSPKELRQFLADLELRPSKKLSQNFLIDGNCIRKLIGHIDADQVIEIGPGAGAITEHLLASGKRVIAVEKDRRLGESLGRFQTVDNKLDIYIEDILDFPKERIPDGCQVVGNLPFSITSPILGHFLPLYDKVDSMVIIVQDEVARRLVAKPGSSDYSALTLFVSLFSVVSYLFKIGRNCFYPAPAVDSAAVALKLHPPKTADTTFLLKIVREAFNHRRKMVRTSLRTFYPQDVLDRALHGIGKDLKCRPEELSLDEFIAFCAQLPPLAV